MKLPKHRLEWQYGNKTYVTVEIYKNWYLWSVDHLPLKHFSPHQWASYIFFLKKYISTRRPTGTFFSSSVTSACIPWSQYIKSGTICVTYASIQRHLSRLPRYIKIYSVSAMTSVWFSVQEAAPLQPSLSSQWHVFTLTPYVPSRSLHQRPLSGPTSPFSAHCRM